MSWNRTGSVSVTNGSTIVIGAGTGWNAGAKVGEALKAPDGQLYEIANINADTQLTLASPYLGATAAGQPYVIVPTQSYMRDLASQAAALINQFSDVVNGAGTGKFAAGSAVAPSVRGQADQDTGMNLPGGDVLQFMTGGVARLQVNPDGSFSVPSGFWPINLSGSFNQSAKLQNLKLQDADGVVTTTAGIDTIVGRFLPGGYGAWYFSNSSGNPGAISANGFNDGALENLQYSPDGPNSYAFQRFCDWRTGDMYTRSVSPGGANVWRKAVITTTDGYARAPKHGTTLTTVVTALNTATQIAQSEGAAGILVLRDDTLGGTGVWLVDPNTGIVPIANMLTGVTIEGAGQAGGYRWSVKVSQGPMPRSFRPVFLVGA